jgi:hypothetical protein
LAGIARRTDIVRRHEPCFARTSSLIIVLPFPPSAVHPRHHRHEHTDRGRCPPATAAAARRGAAGGGAWVCHMCTGHCYWGTRTRWAAGQCDPAGSGAHGAHGRLAAPTHLAPLNCPPKQTEQSSMGLCVQHGADWGGLLDPRWVESLQCLLQGGAGQRRSSCGLPTARGGWRGASSVDCDACDTARTSPLCRHHHHARLLGPLLPM